MVCATFRDHRELARLGLSGVEYLFHDYASIALEEIICGVGGPQAVADPIAEVARLHAQIKGRTVVGIVSTDDYPGSALAAIMAKELGFKGVEPRVNLLCQHKYLSRLEQRRLVPDAVPDFIGIDVREGAELPEDSFFPAFVKPVKSFFSIGAGEVASPDALRALTGHWRALDEFFLPLDRMLEAYAGISVGGVRLIAESLLKGRQVTVEGYAYDGEVTVLGVVDSIFFPGTLAFSRFDYPSSLPDHVQERMSAIATRLMLGVGYRDGMFNIEMMYDEDRDRISIIEINPRMASQFADLYEKVDGTNSYTILLDIGRGVKPTPERRNGPYAFAASCVLRAFEDCVATRLPSEDNIAWLEAEFAGIRVEVHATVGRKLSDEMQDGGSYRYGIVNLGGRDLADVLAKFEVCRERLGIVLEPAPR